MLRGGVRRGSPCAERWAGDGGNGGGSGDAGLGAGGLGGGVRGETGGGGRRASASSVIQQGNAGAVKMFADVSWEKASFYRSPDGRNVIDRPASLMNGC